jgi:aminoglycoside phosphotransferase family enzyme
MPRRLARRPAVTPRDAETPGPDERLRFLRAAATHGLPPGTAIELVETNMAWVVLAGPYALKLKKPVRRPFLDFGTLRARERACREELRLNARLAPDVYLGLDALQWDGRALALVAATARRPGSRTLDWLVRMRRLPRERMLDALIARGALGPAEVDALADALVAFYRAAPAAPPPDDGYVARFEREHAINRQVLCDPRLGLAPRATAVLDRFGARLALEAPRLRARVAAGRVVDGHGDLRAEHVCLDGPPVVIDALEFSPDLRRVDPLDEAALLGVECEALGAPWVGPRVAARLATGLGDADGPALLPFYRAWRALLRARLALAHLADPSPRTPARWAPLAARFVAIAATELGEPAVEVPAVEAPAVEAPARGTG